MHRATGFGSRVQGLRRPEPKLHRLWLLNTTASDGGKGSRLTPGLRATCVRPIDAGRRAWLPSTTRRRVTTSMDALWPAVRRSRLTQRDQGRSGHARGRIRPPICRIRVSAITQVRPARPAVDEPCWDIRARPYQSDALLGDVGDHCLLAGPRRGRIGPPSEKRRRRRERQRQALPPPASEVHTGTMDAKSPAEDELASLRWRAYGPDADISADPHAQARLAELERQHSTRESDTSAVARTPPPIGRATDLDDPPTVETAHGSSAAPHDGARRKRQLQRHRQSPYRARVLGG